MPLTDNLSVSMDVVVQTLRLRVETDLLRREGERTSNPVLLEQIITLSHAFCNAPRRNAERFLQGFVT
jgi:hypothetical protein